MNGQTSFDFGSAVAVPTAGILHLPGWVPGPEADALYLTLRDGVPWEIHRIHLFGRWVDSPRLSCWMGDADAHYRYSGADFAPSPWLPALLPLRERLQQACRSRFNSVLLNRYRDGRDSMGWHSDDEPELGERPVIASLSLGAPRRFLLRRRDDHSHKREFLLGHGDLLVMAGDSQRDWQHALPKTARPLGERINLTFRRVVAATVAPRRAGR